MGEGEQAVTEREGGFFAVNLQCGNRIAEGKAEGGQAKGAFLYGKTDGDVSDRKAAPGIACTPDGVKVPGPAGAKTNILFGQMERKAAENGNQRIAGHGAGIVAAAFKFIPGIPVFSVKKASGGALSAFQ